MGQQDSTAKLPTIPGVEQLDVVPEGARKFLGPYYADEFAQLVSDAKGLRDRASHVIAPDGKNCFSIYRRATNKELSKP